MQDSLQNHVDHLIEQGISGNTRRAYRQDLAYFTSWHRVRFEQDPIWPVPVDTLLQLIVDHAGTLPEAIAGPLIRDKKRKSRAPWSINTLKRVLSTLASHHRQQGLTDPTKQGQVRLLIRRLSRQRSGPQRKQAITRDILSAMLATCRTDNLIDCRDRALLLTGFASGGRRRSEIAAMQVTDLQKTEQGFLLCIAQSKTDKQGKGYTVPVLGEAATALSNWLIRSGVQRDSLFRSINRHGQIGRSLSDRAIHLIVQQRLIAAGLKAEDYSAHSLRSGFITESARQGIALPEAMALSGHTTLSTALGYYRRGQLEQNASAWLI